MAVPVSTKSMSPGSRKRSILASSAAAPIWSSSPPPMVWSTGLALGLLQSAAAGVGRAVEEFAHLDARVGVAVHMDMVISDGDLLLRIEVSREFSCVELGHRGSRS